LVPASKRFLGEAFATAMVNAIATAVQSSIDTQVFMIATPMFPLP
jgi:hypothetical protein